MNGALEASVVMEQFQSRYHSGCYVCQHGHGSGLDVDYKVSESGQVQAVFDCLPSWRGYHGWVHGGVIASVLDGAMTHCLFAKGVAGVTADLRIRYRLPLRIGQKALVVAVLQRDTSPIYVVDARIEQAGKIHVVSAGKFMGMAANKELW